MVRNLKLIVKREFSAAHKIVGYQGNCANIHGHTWLLEVILKVDDNVDMEFDFRDIKRTIEENLPDHTYLNEVYDFNPTAENLAKHLYYTLKEMIPILTITIWESKDTGAIFP